MISPTPDTRIRHPLLYVTCDGRCSKCLKAQPSNRPKRLFIDLLEHTHAHISVTKKKPLDSFSLFILYETLQIWLNEEEETNCPHKVNTERCCYPCQDHQNIKTEFQPQIRLIPRGFVQVK